jgi:TonB family protein
MFNNLIESTSHTQEFKRRGSFLLFTTATYAVLLVLAGVASIYAYDARLEQQSLEIVTLISPREIVPERPPEEASRNDQPRNTHNSDSGVFERATPMLSVNHPESVPEFVSTTPNKNLPVPEHGIVRFTGRDVNPGSAGGPGSPFGGGRQVVQPAQIVTLADQPPPPDPPKPPKVISKGVITGLATSLPRPMYPEIAKRMGIQGAVSVQVLVDESGRVVSAKALSGSPFLTTEAQKAALQARFSPTMLGDQAVKVSGVITYHFVLNR